MIQRSIVWRAWLARCRDSGQELQYQRVRQFFDQMAAHPDHCWDALEPEMRSSYYDALEEIVAVLVRTDDPLVIYNCFRAGDFGNPREAALARKFIAECDPERHQCTLQFLSDIKELQSAFLSRQFPESVKAILQPRKSHEPEHS
jgi:hypothetical protein